MEALITHSHNQIYIYAKETLVMSLRVSFWHTDKLFFFIIGRIFCRKVADRQRLEGYKSTS